MTTPSIPTPPDAAQVAAASVSAAANSSAIRTPWREFWRKFKKQHVAMAALAFVLLLVLVAVFAPYIVPYDAEGFFDYDRLNEGPSVVHWFGVDPLGRDIFSRILMGARISLAAGFLSVMIGCVIGTALGLLAGYYENFDSKRIQIIGLTEMSYLDELSTSLRNTHLEKLFSFQPPAIVLTRGMQPLSEMMQFAKQYGVPILMSTEMTSALMGQLITTLSTELAPRITRHGVLVEVYGEGILILGDSGIGKSETAIELVKRGHRLVADDAVELRKVSNRQIMGTAPENIRHFIELRGIGIVNVARVYGVGAVKLSESLDLVVQLEAWDPTKNYQRTGLESEYYDILGVSIPSTSIPVSPGRNLAVVLETAAINNRQKKMGYNAAKELLIRLGLDDKMD